ncbi:hypothetical protein BS50DRAFT_584658 [Corynespora cassiicola Philippines]|uniref:F-box domain-containing protein n=1 Tax=Corynespora cassiicola Philippines TaxID=1448308 RepID=A0A2T2P0B7_CORCC|nr:hypothetical protein BS50DRAFT_584658 [Corynespora cassiicola Philippines]
MARENKKTLSRLSRVCRKLHEICIPILYHYYATAGIQTEWRQIVCFAQNLLEQPHLRKFVKALAITGIEELEYGSEQENIVMEILEAGNRDFSRVCSPYSYGIRCSRETLDRLIVAMAEPTLEYLLLTRPSDNTVFKSEYHEWTTLGSLSRLEVLPLTGSDEEEVLIVADCGSAGNIFSDPRVYCQNLYDDYYPPWKNIRRLSLNGLDPGPLEMILGHCPQLEDLELYNNAVLDGIDTPLVRNLNSCRKTLRRLVLSVYSKPDDLLEPWNADTVEECQEIENRNAADKYHRHNFLVIDPSSLKIGLSFEEFSSLSILEIDQGLLYGLTMMKWEKKFHPDREGVEKDLVSSLPQSLQVLHVGFVMSWEHIYHDLLELAKTRQVGSFPHLSTICVDPLEVPELIIFSEEAQHLISVLKESDIYFCMGRNTVSSRHRGMLPQRPDDVEEYSVPPGLYQLSPK